MGILSWEGRKWIVLFILTTIVFGVLMGYLWMKADKLNKDILAKESVIKSQNESMNNLKTENNMLKDKITVLEGDIKKLKHDLESLMATNENLRFKNELLGSENNVLKKQQISGIAKIASSDVKPFNPSKTSRSGLRGKKISVIATAYTSDCEGCTGITKTGIDVRNSTPNIIAVDPDVIPLGSVCEIWVEGEYFGVFRAEDIGGAIKGNRIDILMETEEKAKKFGVRSAEVVIIG